MKYLMFLFLIAGCNNQQQSSQTTTKETDNEYELVRVGPYCCVGMDGYESGGIWCERTANNCELK